MKGKNHVICYAAGAFILVPTVAKAGNVVIMPWDVSINGNALFFHMAKVGMKGLSQVRI